MSMGIKQTLVIYHANCFDGFCCAWLFHRVYPDAEFHAAHYGTEPPLEKAALRDTYVADFSYKRPDMRRLAEVARSLIVLDHHKTAQAELEGFEDEYDNVDVFFDMDK